MSAEGLDCCGQVGHVSMQTWVSSLPNGLRKDEVPLEENNVTYPTLPHLMLKRDSG